MPEFFIHIENGEITNTLTVKKAFNEIKKVDGWHRIKTEPGKKRSNASNRYFHGPMLDLVFEGLRNMGFNEIKSKEDAKMVVKSLFLKRHFANPDTGEVIEYIQDTHKLTKVEMSELIEDVIRWAAEYLNVQIKYPNEQLIMDY